MSHIPPCCSLSHLVVLTPPSPSSSNWTPGRHPRTPLPSSHCQSLPDGCVSCFWKDWLTRLRFFLHILLVGRSCSKWQYLQVAPMGHPVGRRKKTHGRQVLVWCSAKRASRTAATSECCKPTSVFIAPYSDNAVFSVCGCMPCRPLRPCCKSSSKSLTPTPLSCCCKPSRSKYSAKSPRGRRTAIPCDTGNPLLARKSGRK
mmetsp:Transcript_111567/g.279401  ORF Transcript_111567/g.279401 Transcript_111567/m.279401 type:complete len:201 (-) Transcript_111567:31-633(-)